ncbi:MAG: MBL fold metallo-hydrolase [Actinomycetota bacterium]
MRSSTSTSTASPTLQFLGGAGTVTGSKYLVRSGGAQVLVDCGLFQGPRALRERNWIEPPFSPASIDAVVLTHAHVDHSGYLPRLVAAGYAGPIFATPSTVELAQIVLPDCGHLQEEEADYANRKGFSRHEPALPLYTEQDAWAAVEQLVPVPFATDCQVAPGVHARLSRAGHILGSASVRLDLGDSGRVIGFSGDLGRPSHPFLVPPDPPGRLDVLVVESTYGDRRHPDSGSSGSDRLAAAISTTIARGGNVLIPAFAVDRTEVLLHHLSKLAAAGRLPAGVPVYVDSPMALSALRVYRGAIERGDPDIRPEASGRSDFFDVPGLHEVREVAESKALNDPASPCIVISASGMGTGGRVVHHLAHMLPDARNTVVLVGFQAEGTRGRQLLDGSRELKMLGRYVRVRADVVDLPAFSVHADGPELLQWIGAADGTPDAVYVVHGEPTASTALVSAIENSLDWPAVAAHHAERVRLDQPH